MVAPMVISCRRTGARAKLRLRVFPPQVVAPTQTFWPQQVWTAHTCPVGQSLSDWQLASPAQGVDPSTQKPDPVVVDAHTQLPPGPHCVNVLQVSPAHDGELHAPFSHIPEAHWSDISLRVIFPTT